MKPNDTPACAYFVVPRLRGLQEQKAALDNIPEEIEILEAQYTAIRAVSTDAEPVAGGTNHREDALIANILRREELAANLEITRRQVEQTEKILGQLQPNERRVLERFYVTGERYCVDRLCEELGYERAQIYRIKDSAVVSFAKRLQGRLII